MLAFAIVCLGLMDGMLFLAAGFVAVARVFVVIHVTPPNRVPPYPITVPGAAVLPEVVRPRYTLGGGASVSS